MKHMSGMVVRHPPDLVPTIPVYGIYFMNKETQRSNNLYKDIVYR